MRKFLILIICLGIFNSLIAQSDKGINKTDIPSSIKEYLDKMYPNHSKIKFYKETKKDSVFYEAVFEMKEDDYSLLFNQQGVLIETEIAISFKEIPSEVGGKISDFLNGEFIFYKIKEIQEVDLKGILLYELAIKARKKENGSASFYEVYFDRNGKFIKIDNTPLNNIPSLF